MTTLRSSLALILALTGLSLGSGCSSEGEPTAQVAPAPAPAPVPAPVPTPVAQPGQPQPTQPQPGQPQAGQPQPGQPGQQQGTQNVQIPGLGNIQLPIPMPNTGSGQQGGQQNSGGIAVPGLPGLNLPLPTGGNTTPGPARQKAPARGSLAPAQPGSYDGRGHMTKAFVDSRVTTLHQMLVAGLPEPERSQAVPIPLRVVNDIRQPNAAAGCTKRTKQAAMIITSAMVTLAAGIAETKALDEVAGTRTLDTYVDQVIAQVRGKQPVTQASYPISPQALDPHKLARQQHLFDQQVAFIIGHEMAHHYRGHTGCVQGRTAAQVETDDLTRMAARAVPIFSQPREVESDMWGTVNVLEAGGQRPGMLWNEEGALLNLDFFGRLRKRGGSELAMLFLSTHPHPQLRQPIVKTTVRQWRPGWRPMSTPGTGNGTGLSVPTPRGNIELPIPLPVKQ